MSVRRKPPVTRSEIETVRSLLIHEGRTATDPERRAILLTEIEACNQRLHSPEECEDNECTGCPWCDAQIARANAT